MLNNLFIPTTNIGDFTQLKRASIPKLHENISVIVGSDEQIFDDMFVSGIINNRVMKFKRDSLVYATE